MLVKYFVYVVLYSFLNSSLRESLYSRECSSMSFSISRGLLSFVFSIMNWMNSE